MTQLLDDCFAHDRKRMRALDALALLAERTACVVGMETVPLAEAHGRFLAEPVVSGRDVPGFDNAAVDGYALAFAELTPGGETRLQLAPTRSAAGDPAGAPLRSGIAVRILTGAMMPRGADTVVMQEDVRLDGGHVVIPAGVKRGSNYRFAGEDIKKGATILHPGQRLRPQDVGVAASVGRANLVIREPLRIALFSTGNELREPGQDLPQGGVYDSNRYMLHGMLRGMGFTVSDFGILPDRRDAVRAAIAGAADNYHVVMTSGGASRGDEDHVVAAVHDLGHLHFWQLAIKPGRPLAFGQIGQTVFVGLPGNPVAAALGLLRFGRPVLWVLAGGQWPEPVRYRVPADFAFRKKAGRREWLRAKLIPGGDGEMRLRKFAHEGSGILTSLTESDGLIELSEDLTEFKAGDAVDFLPFRELGIA